MKNFQHIASLVGARLNCIKSGNVEWKIKHEERVRAIVEEEFPTWSSFDSGTQIDLARSTGEKLVFSTAYHHMNDSGMYDGWTEHFITVQPSLAHGFLLNVSGRNRNDIKEYMLDCFRTALDAEVKQVQQ